MVFIFQFVDVGYHTDWFANIEAHLIMMYDLFDMLLDSLCYNFVEYFLHLC